MYSIFMVCSEIAHEHVLPSPPLTSTSYVQSPQTTQAFTDVITDGVRLRMRWWGGFDLIRRLMFIVAVTLVDFIQPDYAHVRAILCVSSSFTYSLVYSFMTYISVVI